MICHRCNMEALDPVEITGSSLFVCLEHLLPEDRRVIDFGCDQELKEHEEHYERQLERVRQMRAEIFERRRKAVVACRSLSGWGDS